MSSMLGGFQSDLGKLSNEIKHLQEESYSMHIQLKNRQALETQLSSYLSDLVVPPDVIRYVSITRHNNSLKGISVQKMLMKVI
jgi:hypothetical protein